jgi:hypothetical protein
MGSGLSRKRQGAALEAAAVTDLYRAPRRRLRSFLPEVNRAHSGAGRPNRRHCSDRLTAGERRYRAWVSSAASTRVSSVRSARTAIEDAASRLSSGSFKTATATWSVNAGW